MILNFFSYAEFLAEDIILVISSASLYNLFKNADLLDKFASKITSNQYLVSSISSTTIHNLLKNSFFERALQAAR